MFLFWRGIMFFCSTLLSGSFNLRPRSLAHSHSRRCSVLPYQVRFKPEPLLTTCLFNFLRFLLHILFVCLTRCACVGAKKQRAFMRGQLNGLLDATSFDYASVYAHSCIHEKAYTGVLYYILLYRTKNKQPIFFI